MILISPLCLRNPSTIIAARSDQLIEINISEKDNHPLVKTGDRTYGPWLNTWTLLNYPGIKIY